MDSEDQDFEHAVDSLYRQEFELLRGMFEGHFSSVVIAGVLEDCDGDVNLAVDTLTRIEDSSSTTVNVALDDPSSTIDTQIERSISAVPLCHNSDMDSTNAHTSSTTSSYAAAFQNTPASAMASTSAAKKPPRAKNTMPKIDYWTPQFKNIIKCYNEGARILVLMRGPPGCGKTYLARVLVESTIGTTDSNNFANHIFSADDHMEINGKYHYSVHRLSEVHTTNQARVLKAVNEGRSPVIVDNTNMTIWEMLPYTRDAVRNGYIIEVVEPSNPWSKSPSQLAKRNIHGVPINKIQAMLQKYEGTHSGKSLLKCFNLYYPSGMEPPVLRKIPAFHKQVISVAPETLKLITEKSVCKNRQVNIDTASGKPDLKSLQSDHSNIPYTLNVNGTLNPGETSNSEYPIQPQNPEAVKKLDEMLKVEIEWENGEEWETAETNKKTKTNAACSSEPKPPRSEANERLGKFIEPSMINDDWTQNLIFMQPEQAASALKETSQIHVQTESIGVLVDVGDFITNQHEDTDTKPNNIQNNNINSRDNNVIDNGTTAHKTLCSGFHKCEQTDKFFINLRKMFKNVPRAVLREIYDNCAGDGNWACSIVLDGIRNNTIEIVNNDLSDSEEEVRVECQCEERYDEIPAISAEASQPVSTENKTISSMPSHKKKPKKDKIVTEESSQVLQNIKKSIQFSENHYSQHYLNRKKMRDYIKEQNEEQARNKNENAEDTHFANSSQTANINELPTSASLPDSSLDHIPLPDSSQNILYQDIPCTSSAATYAVPTTSASGNSEWTNADDEYEDDDNDTIESDDEKSVIGDNRNVIVNIGMDFVKILDELFGRRDFEYPEVVKPVLSIPTKILHDLNALWVESITYQLDNDHKQTSDMIQQDEEFARQVDIKLQLEADEADEIPSEEENARALPETGKPQKPKVPSLKEIMDTELALAIYEREVKEEWKNKEPQDLAAQMTRKKLCEIFPDVASETLSELLIAHGNSFDATVEILMISTGQGHYLDQSNGINKFIMLKEIENKEKVLMAEQMAALDDDQYPYLYKPGTEQVELSMDTVNVMRKKADIHKNARDTFFQKAQWYYENKRFSEASYYSQIAALHTARYDKASNYAAAILVQYHANIHPEANVIDLHFLRVSEAENSLDLFIDDRLRKIRQTPQARSLVLRIITGRGKHSPGRARVKPAIMKRLQARGIKFRQQNPGLLEARLKPTHLLTVELQNT